MSELGVPVSRSADEAEPVRALRRAAVPAYGGTGGVLAAVPDAGQPADAGGSPGRGVRAGVLAGPVSAEDVRRGTSSLTSGKFREMQGCSPYWRFSPVKPALNRCNEKRKGPRKTRLGVCAVGRFSARSATACSGHARLCPLHIGAYFFCGADS